MDEFYLTSLSLIPGVGEVRARILAERFPTIASLRAARAEEIDALPGFDLALARLVQEFAETSATGLNRGDAEEAELLLCPKCGAVRGRGETAGCSSCDATLKEVGATPVPEVGTGSTAESIGLAKQAAVLGLCPRCGALYGGDTKQCSRCSVALVEALETAAKVEGLAARGRVSATGFVNGMGRSNRMTPAMGRVNGLATSLPPGEGMVNGLINGNGITNGNRGGSRPPRAIRSRMRSARGITAIVLLLLLLPVLAVLLSTPTPFGGIAIDGQFADWALVPRYDDTVGDSSPALDLADYRLRSVENALLVYAKVTENLWGVPGGHTESVFVFVDEDGDPATGFQVGGVGAERAAEFYGWDGALWGSQSWTYDLAIGATSDDWRALRASGSLDVASAHNQIEAAIIPGPAYNADRAQVLFHTWSTLGEGDAADAVVGRATGALSVSQNTLAAEVLVASQEPVLAFTIRPLAASIRVAAVTIRESGSLSPSSVMGSLFLDSTGDGAIDATDPLLGTAPFGPDATFGINRTLGAAESYILRADFLALTPNASVGFRVVAVSTDADATVPVTLLDANVSMSYLLAAPANVTIDGAFADWARHGFRTDADDDVRSISGAPEVNGNIDLRAYEAVVDANVSLYLRVDGRILGGADIPNARGRFGAVPMVDSDGDTVPDEVEQTLGPRLANDFNNDNLSDADQFVDVDQDGVLDYNKCPASECTAYTDYMLETTLPSWYPPPYGAKLVQRYIGPVSLPPQRGVDTALVYVDRDNKTETGLLLYMDGMPYGMDYAYQAVGRGGSILEAGLYAHNSSRTIPWEKVADVPTGLDDHRLEAAFDATLLNLTASHTIVFATTDWKSNTDESLPAVGTRGATKPATRTTEGPRVFDIPGNQKLYFRNTNHATETACTVNKVATPSQGTGPIVSTTVTAGQSACWYADSTTGTTIPAGDWETLLDVNVRHGIAVYGELVTSNPRYREWNGGSFGAEGSGNPTGFVTSIQWVVVASSPTSPEKVVGILASDGFLYVQTWDGATWTSNWNTNLQRDQTREFDVAYEDQSGDVVVVFGDATSQLKYRKRVGGTWDGSNMDAGSPLADIPYYVRVAENPTNNDIMTAVGTNANTLHALRWDGAANTWGNQVQMPDVLAAKDEEAFDVAYERAPGHAFVVWGNDVNALRYREFTSSWGSTTTAYSLPDRAMWVTAAADPDSASSRIAVGMVLNNGNFEFGAWTGASWTARPAPIAARDKGERGIDVGFEAKTNRAMFVFNQNSNPTQMAWRTWTEAGGFGSVTVEPGSSGNLNFVQVRPSPYQNDIMVLYADANSDLFHRRWDGAAWSSLGGALETILSAQTRREAFMFAWTRVVEYDVYLEIWHKSSNSVSETIGSCLNQRVYGNDVQCLITGVAAKVLNPNQVVRIRIVHSSPGGSFALSYDDATTAGNSRATIPSVSIPEFEVLAAPTLTALLAFGFYRRRANRRTPRKQAAWSQKEG